MSTTSLTDRSVPDQWDEVWAVLQDGATRSFAAGRVRRLGLAGVVYSTDDLLNTVGMKVWHHLLRGNRIDDGKPDAVRRYVYRVLVNAGKDLFEALTRPEAPVVVGYAEADDMERHAVLPDPGDVETFDWDAARAVARAHMAPRTPWLTAAVLAHLAVEQDPDRPLPPRLRLPQGPARGKYAGWVALQYAGRDNCFAEPEKPQVRKRRSTALMKVHKAMEATLADAWELPERFRSDRSVSADR